LTLRRLHQSEINKNAAIRLQATAKMYMVRKRYQALKRLRAEAAAKLTQHYRRQIAYLRFRKALKSVKHKAVLLVQKYMRGYR
jgi:hypothetical protein